MTAEKASTIIFVNDENVKKFGTELIRQTLEKSLVELTNMVKETPFLLGLIYKYGNLTDLTTEQWKNQVVNGRFMIKKIKEELKKLEKYEKYEKEGFAYD